MKEITQYLSEDTSVYATALASVVLLTADPLSMEFLTQ